MNNKVAVIGRTKIELLEDLKKGEIIDLEDLMILDLSHLDDLIEDNYQKRLDKKIEEINSSYEKEKKNILNDQEKELNYKYNKDIEKFKDEINSLKIEVNKLTNEKTIIEELTREKALHEFEQKNSSLKHEIEILKNDKENALKDFEKDKEYLVNKATQDANMKITNLQNEITKLKLENDINIKNQEANLKDKYDQAINKLKEDNQQLKTELQEVTYQRSNIGTKLIGEDLESWCLNEYKQYESCGGFETCSFYKDNLAIVEEGENKGTKADFIFKVYNSNDFKDENLLTSVCLEMKNEALNSKNKKKNSDHFDKLNKDRLKKKCEYALLVSTLEMDNNNDVPFYKVKGYENMFVVRPQYYISFLGLIYSLANKYQDLTIELNKEKEGFKESEAIINEFNKLKKMYLEDIIAKIEKEIGESLKFAQNVREYNEKTITKLQELINNTLITAKEKSKDLILKK